MFAFWLAHATTCMLVLRPFVGIRMPLSANLCALDFQAAREEERKRRELEQKKIELAKQEERARQVGQVA